MSADLLKLKKENKKLKKQVFKNDTEILINGLSEYIDNFYKNTDRLKFYNDKIKENVKRETMRFFSNLFRQIEKGRNLDLFDFKYDLSKIFFVGFNTGRKFTNNTFNFKVKLHESLFNFKNEESKKKFLKMLKNKILVDSNGYANTLELFLFDKTLTSHDEKIFGVKNSSEFIIYYISYGLKL